METVDESELRRYINETHDNYSKIKLSKRTPVMRMILHLIEERGLVGTNKIDMPYLIFDCFRIIKNLQNIIDERDINNFDRVIGPDYFYLPLIYLSEHIDNKEFWRILGDKYTSCNPRVNRINEEYFNLFQSKKPWRKHVMSKAELAFLTSLPQTVKIYRGMSYEEYEFNEFRFSWTLSEERANFFANEFYSRLGTVVSLEIPKRQIIAYLNERSEQEIIYAHSPDYTDYGLE